MSLCVLFDYSCSESSELGIQPEVTRESRKIESDNIRRVEEDTARGEIGYRWCESTKRKMGWGTFNWRERRVIQKEREE